MKANSIFNQREVAIITKHQKERVIAPILESEFGMKPYFLDSFDTDQFGMFNGSIERKNDPVNTLIEKCKVALDKYGLEMGVASEGSFGPHPFIPFISANEEWMIFIDRKNKVELIERSISTHTNFNQTEIFHLGELFSFVQKIGFPEHGVILKDRINQPQIIFENIQHYETLIECYYKLLNSSGRVFVETDMRAHHNPTRMKHIEQLTLKICESLQNQCPKCEFPGFKIKNAIQGLPCECCGYPTHKAIEYHKICDQCGHTEHIAFPEGKKVAEPEVCDSCNP